jgi:curved DNA-binding protein CbpA
VKTHYELIGVDSSADAETIKKAFRQEIAKYHPDKVTHLGAEFQEMASVRAAELTAAYKILTDPEARAEYDQALREGRAPTPIPGMGSGAASAPSRASDATEERVPTPEPERAPARQMFDTDRAGKDDIVRRATLARLRGALNAVIGDSDIREVRGFDLACIPRPKPVTSLTITQFFKREVMPIVLVRLGAVVDAAMATDAFAHAVRARLDSKGKPVAVLMIGQQLAPSSELARAVEDARKKSPASLDTIFPVPIDLRDWSAKIPLNAPNAVRTLIDRLKSSV